MEIDDKEIVEQIQAKLQVVDDGEHISHKLTCLVNVIVIYENDKVTLKKFEVHQGECEHPECRRKGGDFPLLLWE